MSNDFRNIWNGPEQLNEDLLRGSLVDFIETIVDWLSILNKS